MTRMKQILTVLTLLSLFCLGFSACGKNEQKGGGSSGGGGKVDPYEGQGGYLFAHTGTGSNYYKLFYALSRDGITWTAL